MSFATSPVIICAHCNRPIGSIPTILGGKNYHYECTQSPYRFEAAWQHQQKRIDELEAQLAIAVEALEKAKEMSWFQHPVIPMIDEALNKISKGE